MNDDYLWDGSGPPDPKVQRLEQMLGRLKSNAPLDAARLKPGPARVWGTASAVPTRWRTIRFLAPAFAAAAAIVVMVGLTWQTPETPAAAWTVAATSGAPRIGSSTV